MVQIVVSEDRLLLQFAYAGMQCIEDSGLPATAVNREHAERMGRALERSIDGGTFSYADTFPHSQVNRMLALLDMPTAPATCPTFGMYAEKWLAERRVEWRQTYIDTIRLSLDKYLIPVFGDQAIDAIDKDAILAFRAWLAKRPGIARGSTLSISRINKILQPLRMILVDAADRLDFRCPWRDIKSIRQSRGRVDPLTLTEVARFLDTVRSDFRTYFEIRFFTGLRTSEINGLDWRAVDLESRTIHVHQALIKGAISEPKNDAADRIVQLSDRVFEGFQHLEEKRADHHDLVFRGRQGRALNNAWMTNHIWYPTLAKIGLSPRRPYQTRHTAATLWLAAGENPQWIARQLGHTTPEMLFRIYSRYVPNTIRRDGAALDAFLASRSLAGRPSAGSWAEHIGITPP